VLFHGSVFRRFQPGFATIQLPDLGSEFRRESVAARKDRPHGGVRAAGVGQILIRPSHKP